MSEAGRDEHFASNLASATQRKNLAILGIMVLVPLALSGAIMMLWGVDEDRHRNATEVSDDNIASVKSSVIATDAPSERAPRLVGSTKRNTGNNIATPPARKRPQADVDEPSTNHLAANEPRLSGLASEHSNIATTITLHNKGSNDAEIYWVDFEGVAMPYAVLKSKQSKTLDTFSGHSWTIRDAVDGHTMAKAVATAKPMNLIIGPPPTIGEKQSVPPEKLALLGNYENHQYDDRGKNDWHYVTLTNAEGDTLIWSNRAGASWTLTLTSEPHRLVVGADSPYFARGHREAIVEFDSNRAVKRISGPGGEWYDRE